MSSHRFGPHTRPRFVVVAGAYVLGVAAAGTLAAASIHRLASGLVDTLAQAVADRPTTHATSSAKQASFSPIPHAVRPTVVGSMQPLQDRWSRGMPFGSSSRGSWRSLPPAWRVGRR
jgi:hypothetical protein